MRLRHALAQRCTCNLMLRLAPTGTNSIVLRGAYRAGQHGAATQQAKARKGPLHLGQEANPNNSLGPRSHSSPLVAMPLRAAAQRGHSSLHCIQDRSGRQPAAELHVPRGGLLLLKECAHLYGRGELLAEQVEQQGVRMRPPNTMPPCLPQIPSNAQKSHTAPHIEGARYQLKSVDGEAATGLPLLTPPRRRRPRAHIARWSGRLEWQKGHCTGLASLSGKDSHT